MGQIANVIPLRDPTTALTASFVATDKASIDGKDSAIVILEYTPKDVAGATGLEARVFLSEKAKGDAVVATDGDWYQQSRQEAVAATGTLNRYDVTHVIAMPAGAVNDGVYKFDIPLPIGEKTIHVKVRETGAPGTPGLLGTKAILRTLGANA